MPPLAYPLARPIARPLAMGLDGAFGPSYHPTAKAIIAAVTAAGATVSSPQKKAIDVFIRAEISAGRWGTKIPDFFLPVWGVQAANAIDWVGLSSGAFTAGVTHAAGYVQGNGTTGQFTIGMAASAGVTTSANGLWVLAVTASSATGLSGIIGTRDGLEISLQLSRTSSTAIRFDTCGSSSALSATLAVANQTGIISAQRSGTSVFISRRVASGRSVLASATVAVGGALPTTFPIWAMRSNWTGNDGRQAAYGVTRGLTDVEDIAFTSNLATLYTALTGNALPA